MRSNVTTRLAKLLLLAVLPAAVTCSTGPFDDDVHYEIGRKPEFFTAAYLWRAGDANSIVAFEKETRTLQQFKLDPFAHELTLELPLKYEKQGIVAGSGGNYFITMAENEYAIVKRDGSATVNPIPMLGDIKSIAFNPDHHLAVITDDFQTMLILVLSNGGDILGTYKSGGNVLPDKLALSGTMMADGRLVLALGETTIYVADLKATVANQAWTASRDAFEVADAKNMTWMSTLPTGGDIVMIVDDKRLLSVNVATGAVVAQKDLTDDVIRGYYRDYTPHIIHQGGVQVLDQQHNISYVNADGTITTKQMLTTRHQVTTTWLDLTSDLFTIVYDTSKDHEFDFEDNEESSRDVYRFRPSDAAGLDKTVTPGRAKLIVTPAHLMLLYHSILGKAERRSYGTTAATASLKGYNLDLLRDRYSQDD